ncbi:tigger transposable element-derived protein 4-like [Dunckerocampus dactyliophorus]|uniref:tigger transposable element-derived protein 4-like n=1 Tax=Dunckerocampus dactyliophorus TaxID=161453 RepID=UPI0024075CC2|nr:tigger transposable element-derived protein 4-like [Dunckerocampus dactyliophorus]
MASKAVKSHGGRNQLSLEKKIELIRMHDKDKLSARAIAVKLSTQGHRCGRTQILNILKRKQEWIEEFQSNMPLDRKRKVRKTANDELNAILYEWFKDSTARQLPVSGPLLQEKAKEIATQLQLDEFKASNGWLDAFRRRHNVIFGKMNGESGGVETAVVDDWKQKLRDLCDGYAFRDIYNMDETGLFYKASIDSTLHFKGTDCSGGKQSKERITLMLCANALGEKEPAMVIGKAIKPHCFGKIDRKDLLVDYHANKKAWMTSNLFELFMTNLNKKMQRQSRKILMLLDDAPCHPHLQLSNIKLIFLPPNTTSITQPMDQGIIQAAKLKFRKRQLRSIIHQMEQEPSLTAPELMRNTDILKAIYWVDRAWKDTSPETIQKCFTKCGVGPQDFEAGAEQVKAEEPGDELDAVCQKELKMSLEELVGADELLATTDQNQATTLEDYQRRLENTDKPQPSQQEPNLISFSEAFRSLEQMKTLAVSKGCIEMLDRCTDLEEAVQRECQRQKQAARQTLMFDFFKKV